MDKTQDSGTWLKFFKDAGIPKNTGASYAHIFVENRIHKDMLSDLTVDHLRLMGITLIGDIIAILRHAKSVHQDSLRKVVILKSKDDPPDSSSSSSSSSVRNSSSSSSSSSSSDSDKDVEMLEVTKPVTKKVILSTARAFETKVKRETTNYKEDTRKKLRSEVKHNTSSASLSKTSTESERRVLNQPLKRKHYENEDALAEDLPAKQTAVKTTNSSTSSGRSILKTQDVPVKKTRPTSELEFIGPKLPPPKKTVFERLGAETSSPQVSSTTEVPRPEVETRFTRTIGSASIPVEPVKIVANIDIPPPKMSSVFNRLGGVTPESQAGSALQYAGVLKSQQVVQRTPLNVTKKIVTMRADEPEVPVKLRAIAKPSIANNIKIRVGEKSFKTKLKPKLNRESLVGGTVTNPASQGIFANPKNALHLSAKERLGLQRRQDALNKSAKARLGLNIAGKIPSSVPVNQRLRRPTGVRSRYANGDDFNISSRVGAGGLKKVSFGRVDQKLISPLRSTRGGGNMKSGIHSRLGTRRFT